MTSRIPSKQTLYIWQLHLRSAALTLNTTNGFLKAKGIIAKIRTRKPVFFVIPT